MVSFTLSFSIYLSIFLSKNFHMEKYPLHKKTSTDMLTVKINKSKKFSSRYWKFYLCNVLIAVHFPRVESSINRKGFFFVKHSQYHISLNLFY